MSTSDLVKRKNNILRYFNISKNNYHKISGPFSAFSEKFDVLFVILISGANDGTLVVVNGTTTEAGTLVLETFDVGVVDVVATC